MEVFTAVIVLATIGQVVVGWMQWDATKGQLDVMKDQTDSIVKQTDSLLQQTELLRNQTRLMAEQLEQADDAAKANDIQAEKSLQHNIKQSKAALDNSIAVSRNDQRAWVGVKEVKFDQVMVIGRTPRIFIQLVNTGKTPAVDVAVASYVVSRTHLVKKDLESRQIGSRVSNIVMLPNASFTADATSDEAFSKQEQITAIQQGINRLFVVGTVYYGDVFRRSWKTDFCFRFEKMNADGLFIGAACAEHNSVE